MALTLVPRHLRALSDHLNSIVRVLRGTDPDSLAIRLPGAGSFEVRHSATAAPVLRVTDAGATLTGVVTLPANSINSTMIVDGTIQGTDIANATIPSSKLITGAAITPESITNAEIADGTVRTQELAANAVSQTYRAAISTGAMAAGGPFDVPGSGLNVAVAAGEACLFGFDGTVAAGTTGAIVNLYYIIQSTTMLTVVPVTTTPLHLGQTIALSDVVVGATAAGQHKLQYSCNAGTVTLVGRMHAVVIKR